MNKKFWPLCIGNKGGEHMKVMRRLVATCAVLAATSSVAWADLILVSPTNTPVATVAASFTDLGAQGFGNAPRLLTMQTNTGVETGSVIPVNNPQGDAEPNSGGNKSNTPTLGALQWTAGNRVGIGFNSGQTGGSGITMQSLTLRIFALDGTTVLGTFNLAASLTPLQFTAADLGLQQGNGNAVFNFGLNAAQQTQFNAIVAMAGSSGFFAGLSSQLGCPAGAPASCQPTNDGPDSFLGFRQNIPEPASIVYLGFALLAVGYARKRMVRA
jgi:hypothetical protein